MCLYLDETFEKNTNEYKNRKKPFFVYKALNPKKNGKYRSPYMKNHTWGRGWNYSNRIDTKLSKYEKSHRTVYDGFHFYTSKDGAYKGEMWLRNRVIVKCKVYPEDIVAVGDFSDSRSLVATKCVLIGKAKRRPGKKQ